MSCINVVASVCLLLLPFSISFADDDETQLLHNNTYQEFASTDCQYQGDCAIVFPATTHQMTVIKNASCNFYVTSGTSIISAVLGTQDFGARFSMPTFYYGYNNGSAIYGINGTASLFVAKGGQPRFDVYSIGSPVRSMLCTISGYHS